MQKDKDDKINDNEIIVIDSDEVTVIDKDNENSDVTFNIDLNSPRASSGEIKKDFHNGGYYLKITWSVTSQSVANNNSSVTVNAILGSNGSSYNISSSASKNISLTINGSTYSGTCTVGISGGKSKTLMTKTVTVGHNSDGTKTCSFSCTLGIAVTLSGTYYSSVSASGSGTFNTINLNSAPVIGSMTAPSTGYIAENATSTTVKWNAASDAQGNLSGYQVYRYVNGTSQYNTWVGNVTSWTDSSLGSWGQGTTIQYGIKAKDSAGLWSGEAKSGTLTKNKMTGATLASSSNIGNATSSIAFTWSGAKNTNGNTTFKYDITCNNSVTVYNATNLTDTKATIKILESGTDTGPYILKSQIISAFKSSSFKGTLTFTLKTKNNYSSTATSTKAISVDLRATPTAATPAIAASTTSTCYKTIGGKGFFIPDGSGTIRITWSGGKDSLGQALKYNLEYKIGSGSYVSKLTGSTATSYDLVLPKQSSSQTLTVRVTTVTSYDYTASKTTTTTLHYYNSPTIEVGKVSRTTTGAEVSVKMKANTSVTGFSFSTRSYSGASSGTLADNQDSQTIKASSLKADTAYTWTVTVKDNTGLQSSNVTKTIDIPAYTVPVFSIREKGVGVKCIPNNVGSSVFEVNGLSLLRDGVRMSSPDRAYSRNVLKAYNGGANGMNLVLESGGNMILGSGESATNYITETSLDGSETEHLFLTSDSTIKLASNCGTIANRTEATFNSGLFTIDTKSTSSNKGIKIIGSGTPVLNLWVGTGGGVLQSVGDCNLHLGRDNSTDMVFQNDRIVFSKHLTGATELTFDISGGERRVAFGSGTTKHWGMYAHSTTLGWYDWKNGRNVLNYNPSENYIYLHRNTQINNTLYLESAVSTSNGKHIGVNTSHDSNGYGDSRTHIGYRTSDGNYHHYFRGKGSMNINCAAGTNISKGLSVENGITGGWSINIGKYEDTFRSFNSRRLMGGTNWDSRYGTSYLSNVKKASSDTATAMYGAVIEAYNATSGSAVRRYLFSNTGLYPMADNNAYCGASTHRWQAIYASTGTVYSSSENEKEGIKALNTSLAKNGENTLVDTIVEGLKNIPMYSYKYKTLNNDEQFVGFLGEELEDNNPEFFNLIGSSYDKVIEEPITEEESRDEEDQPTVIPLKESEEELEEKEVKTVKQYDIREASLNGVIMVGLQQALLEIDKLKAEIQELKGENKNV